MNILRMFGKTFSEQLRVQIETEELRQQRLEAAIRCAEFCGRSNDAAELQKELSKSIKTWMTLRKKAGLV